MRAIKNKQIRIPIRPVKNVTRSLNEPVIYKSKDYGFVGSATGKDVNICVIDTGCPVHNDLKHSIIEGVNFSDASKDYYDEHGHATMVAGVVSAKNENAIMGIAPKANLFFGKVSKQDGDCDYNAIVAAVLWAIVKKVDIILMSLATPLDYNVLHEVIKKAHSTNICIMAAAAGGVNSNRNRIVFPAAYSEVLSFNARPKGKSVKSGPRDDSIYIPMPHSGITTTFGKQEYTKVYGSSIAAGLGAGLAALIIEKRKAGKTDRIDPQSVYLTIRAMRISGQ